MGRKPNSLILQYFDRGEKLADSSNRYPHTCKACGEHFPKGRIDSLTAHLTKRCPAISEADRISAVLALNGLGSASHRSQLKNPQGRDDGPIVNLPMLGGSGRDWTALETLAEAAKFDSQVNEKPDDRTSNGAILPAGGAPPTALHATERFELSEPFMIDHPITNAPTASDAQQEDGKQPEQDHHTAASKEQSDEDKLRALFQTSGSQTNLSMAAAAAARLHPGLLDPQLLGQGDTTTTSIPDIEPVASLDRSPGSAVNTSQPWGELTYAADALPSPSAAAMQAQNVGVLTKGGFRLDTSTSPGGSKARHARARFDATRRKEVQEVRKIGACIRCRILRKTCSKGDPCDTCRKVLSPRIWRSGCVRTRFSEQLSLYSAGVQVVLAQQRMNGLKGSMKLENRGAMIQTSHFPESKAVLSLQMLQRDPSVQPAPDVDPDLPNGHFEDHSIVMIDTDIQDVPSLVEAYMREILPELIRRENSHFMRTTLETAVRVVEDTHDALLRKALELWGLVEILDRERQWHVTEMADPARDKPARQLTEGTDAVVFTTICLQLVAAAERKAGTTSKSLLTGMQRILQDSKTKIDYGMYFATLILLNCIEKSTWAFKAWEQPNLRHLWPLEREPGTFTNQGNIMADLLRMLLSIRRALPRTTARESDGMLITEEGDLLLREYFEKLALNFAEVQSKQESQGLGIFEPSNSRSLELLFCSTLLLPSRD